MPLARHTRAVFIVGLPRTGTTVLRRWLAQNGGMDCDEIFTEELHQPTSYYRFLADSVAQDPKAVLPWRQRQVFAAFLDRLAASAEGRPLLIDAKYHTLNHIPQPYLPRVRRPFLVQHMVASEARAIHLVRRNKLRQILSQEIAGITDVWGLDVSDPVPEKPKVTLKPEGLATRIDRLIRLDADILETLSAVPGLHQIAYEDMFTRSGTFSDPAMEIAAACVPGPLSPEAPSSRRMNPEPISSLLANPRDVIAALRDTPHAWMLDAETA